MSIDIGQLIAIVALVVIAFAIGGALAYYSFKAGSLQPAVKESGRLKDDLATLNLITAASEGISPKVLEMITNSLIKPFEQLTLTLTEFSKLVPALADAATISRNLAELAREGVDTIPNEQQVGINTGGTVAAGVPYLVGSGSQSTPNIAFTPNQQITNQAGDNLPGGSGIGSESLDPPKSLNDQLPASG